MVLPFLSQFIEDREKKRIEKEKESEFRRELLEKSYNDPYIVLTAPEDMEIDITNVTTSNHASTQNIPLTAKDLIKTFDDYIQRGYVYDPKTGDITGSNSYPPLNLPIFDTPKNQSGAIAGTMQDKLWTQSEVNEILRVKGYCESIFNTFVAYCLRRGIIVNKNSTILTGGLIFALFNGDKIKEINPSDIDFFILNNETLADRDTLLSQLMASPFTLAEAPDVQYKKPYINSVWTSETDTIYTIGIGDTHIPFNTIVTNCETRGELIDQFDFVHNQAAYYNDQLWISRKTYDAIKNFDLIPVDPKATFSRKRLEKMYSKGLKLRETNSV